MKTFLLLIAASSSLLISSKSFSAEAQLVQDNLSAIMLAFAAAFVFLMQVGFAFLEAGVCRSKNTVNIMMKNFVDISVSVLVFWAIGFALLFGNNPLGLFGSSYFFLNGLDTKDHAFALYQMMFAATAVTITSGAMAERTKFFGYLVSAVLITGLIYPIAASWVWGGLGGGEGWLAKMGFIDFAGSTVVHSVGGWVALAGIMVLGARSGRFDNDGKPTLILGHNLSFVAFGGIILWIGWFGFNGGSIITADVSIGTVLLNTHLVSITAGAATMTPIYAVIAGFIGGFVVFFGEKLLLKLKLDDVIGAVPVHAFCGVWGTIAAGLFYAGDLFSIDRVIIQLIGIISILIWSLLTALLVYFTIDSVFGLRVDRRTERRGLDYTEHYEVAYPEFSDVITHAEKK